MEPILVIGIILFAGFFVGELCTHIGLPKVTGYILAGLILNPNLTHFIPESFVDCVFRSKPATHSGETCHLFRLKVATHSV